MSGGIAIRVLSAQARCQEPTLFSTAALRTLRTRLECNQNVTSLPTVKPVAGIPQEKHPAGARRPTGVERTIVCVDPVDPVGPRWTPLTPLTVVNGLAVWQSHSTMLFVVA